MMSIMLKRQFSYPDLYYIEYYMYLSLLCFDFDLSAMRNILPVCLTSV